MVLQDEYLPSGNEPLSRDAFREEIRAYVIEQRTAGVQWNEIEAATGHLYHQNTLRAMWQEHQKSQPADRFKPLPSSTIVNLAGPNGSGKSLYAAYIARQYYLQGRPVLFNPPGLLKFPPSPGRICRFVSLKELTLLSDSMRGALVVLDEIQRTLSKWRSSALVNTLLLGALQQTRKVGADVIGTSNTPQDIHSSFQGLLTFHGHCKSYFPPDYPGMDAVTCQWVDSHGRFGRGTPRSVRGAHIDDRIRWGEGISPASFMFPYYNTAATVEPFEIMGMTPDALMVAREEETAGVTVDEAADFIRLELVPDIVLNYRSRGLDQAATSLQPSVIVLWIAKQYLRGYDHLSCCGWEGQGVKGLKGCQRGKRLPLEMSELLFGQACRKAGLLPKHTRSGTVYPLPPPERVPAYQSGMWSFADEA